MSFLATFNPALDLMLERVVDVPVDLVWSAWTEPKHIIHWFCPIPWTVTEAEIELHVGGKFNTVMRSPEGVLYPNVGSLLEVEPNRRLVFTDALQEGFRPTGKSFMTGCIALEAIDAQTTRYTAMAIHNDAAARAQHETMGFHRGWGTALDQLVAHMKSQR